VSAATVVIVARNAALTIQRAVRSAIACAADEILLVDDWSSDGTPDLARATAPTLRVVRPVEHRTLGYARQCAVESLATPYAVWLDADDEMVPGRVARFVEALSAGEGSVAADGLELWSGESGAFIERVPVPAFLMRDPLRARLFERNYLPVTGPVAVKTAWAREVGYDPDLQAAEDYDFVLRSVASGARVVLLDHIGYRQYAYAASVSRNSGRQRAMCQRVLRKHDYSRVRALLLASTRSTRLTAWAMVSFAVQRGDFEEALALLGEAERGIDDPAVLLEPDGPCPVPEGWRAAFWRGTLRLQLSRDDQALTDLQLAEHLWPSPEGANNLGVALRRLNQKEAALEAFGKALSRKANYADAAANIDRPADGRLTLSPLRRHPFRQDRGLETG
jgi:hypothetical protein